MFPINASLNVKEGTAVWRNHATFMDYYYRLRSLALSVFKWDGLPDTVNARFLEKTLFDYGKAVFVKDDKLGFLVTKCTPSGSLNFYDEPISYQAYGINYTKFFKADDCVIIRNNIDMFPTSFTLSLFANRLYDTQLSMDINVKGQKTPILIKCDEKSRLTLKNLYKQYEGNEPVIFADKSLDPDSIKAIKTDSPFVADKLFDYKNEIYNECMTFLGINNANTDKKERLITDEVVANNQLIEMGAQVMLMTRQEAAENINKKYGLNVSVKMRYNSDDQDNTETEGMENE